MDADREHPRGLEAGLRCAEHTSAHDLATLMNRLLNRLCSLFWAVVERSSLVNNMHRQKHKRLVTDDFDASVRYITDGYVGITASG